MLLKKRIVTEEAIRPFYTDPKLMALLRIKIEPFPEAPSKVYVWFVYQIYSILLHPLHSGKDRFLCRDTDLFWDSVETKYTVLYCMSTLGWFDFNFFANLGMSILYFLKSLCSKAKKPPWKKSQTKFNNFHNPKTS